MVALVMELNDSDIRVADSESLRFGSPGYALLNPEGIIVGAAARERARLQPRQTISQFWMRLDTEPLAHAHPAARHHADLAFAHLTHIHRSAGEPGEIVFAVPGHFSRDQLAVLLGIARRCAFRAIGLVDSAVAAASQHPLSAHAIHLDIQLHQSVITHLELRGGELTRTGVDVVPGAGLSQLQDRWARVITRSFIQQSRFDPMHAATSEQQLYDRMPGWLAAIAREGDTHAELTTGRNTYRAQLRLGELVEAARDVYRQIVDAIGPAGSGSQILLSHRMAELPGFADFLPGSAALPASAVAAGCATHTAQIQSDDQALRFVIRLPATIAPAGSAVARAQPVAASRAARPSHLVVAGRAYRLGNVALHLLHRDGDGWQPQREAADAPALTLRGDEGGVWLEPQPHARLLCNDKPVTAATRVYAGDRLRIDGIDAGLLLVTETPVRQA